MKAKDIVKKLTETVEAGVDASEAFSIELLADFVRMRDQNKERKGGDAALLRCMREYNQKWNSVILQVNELPQFKHNGRTWLHLDDFMRMVIKSVVARTDCSEDEVDKEVDLLLRPTSVSNEAVRRAKANEAQARLHEEARRAALYRLVFGL